MTHSHRDALETNLTDSDRELLERFVEGNLIAEQQSRLGLSKPIDLQSLLERVEKLVLEHRMKPTRPAR